MTTEHWLQVGIIVATILSQPLGALAQWRLERKRPPSLPELPLEKRRRKSGRLLSRVLGSPWLSAVLLVGNFCIVFLQAKLPGPLTRPSAVLISLAVTGIALSYATFVWIRSLRDLLDPELPRE